MRCQRYRERIIAHARSSGASREIDEALAHVETCAACRQTLEEQQALTAALQALAESDRAEAPSGGLELRLMAAFEAQRAAAAPARPGPDLAEWLRRRPLWLAAAGMVAAAGAILWLTISGPRTKPDVASEAAPSDIVELAGFQPVPLAVALPDFDSGAIVRTELAVNALPVYGVRIPPDAAGEAVTVDLLVGQDGHPRAIRLVTEEFRTVRSR